MPRRVRRVAKHRAVALGFDFKADSQFLPRPDLMPGSVPRRGKGRNSAFACFPGTSICSPSTSYSLRFTMVHTVCRPAAGGWGKCRSCSIGASGSHSGCCQDRRVARSIVAIRRVASASRGVMPFQIPQMFSQLSQPTPLKKANCRSSVLSRFQRSEMFTMWRGSSHLYLLDHGD